MTPRFPIVAVVDNPNKIVPGHSGRLNYYAVVATRRLRVTIDGATSEAFTVAVAQGN